MLFLVFRTVPDLYCKKLINDGIMTEDQLHSIVQEHTKWLNKHLKSVDNYTPEVSTNLSLSHNQISF